MAKKKVKLKKDNDIRQRLVNIEIDEISLVDKPAINEEFIITKRVNEKGGKAVAKKKLIKTAKEIQKGVFWKRSFKKDEKGCDHGDHCVFCGITKTTEAEEIGMGLRNNVCFKCAIQHMEKGVLELCISGKFDLELFKETHPGVELYTKTEGDGDAPPADGDAVESEDPPPSDEGNKPKDAEEPGDDVGNKSSSKAEDDSESDEDEAEDGEGSESESESDDSESDEDGDGDSESESDEDDADDSESESEDPPSTDETEKGIKKRVTALEKGLEDVLQLLEGAAEFHEQAVIMLNQQAELLVGALEMVMMLEMGDTQVQQADELRQELKNFHGTVQKAGAKISSSRLQTLRDIAEKLTALIQSVAGESQKQGGKKGGKQAKKKSVEMESLTKELSELKKSVATKDEELKKMVDRLDDLEAFGDASQEIDDEDDDSDSSSETEGSVFKDFGPLKGVTDRIQKHTRISTIRKS